MHIYIYIYIVYIILYFMRCATVLCCATALCCAVLLLCCYCVMMCYAAVPSVMSLDLDQLSVLSRSKVCSYRILLGLLTMTVYAAYIYIYVGTDQYLYCRGIPS
jgi:hypothetical protein